MSSDFACLPDLNAGYISIRQRPDFDSIASANTAPHYLDGTIRVAQWPVAHARDTHSPEAHLGQEHPRRGAHPSWASWLRNDLLAALS